MSGLSDVIIKAEYNPEAYKFEVYIVYSELEGESIQVEAKNHIEAIGMAAPKLIEDFIHNKLHGWG